MENERFFERARDLRREMSEWSLSVSKEVDEILALYPIEMPPRNVPDSTTNPNSNASTDSTIEK